MTNRIVINQIPAFQTTDGERFFAPEDARTHARGLLFEAVLDRAIAGDPNFARLDRELTIKLMRGAGVTIGEIARDPLGIAAYERPAAAASPPPAARPIVQSERPRLNADHEPRFTPGMTDPLKQAMSNVDRLAAAAAEDALTDMERELRLDSTARRA